MGERKKKEFNEVANFRTIVLEGFHPDFLLYTSDKDLPECLWTVTVDKNGEPHSYFGRPSVVATSLGTGEVMFEAWHKDGKLHRKPDLPAMIIKSYGYQYHFWFQNDLLHRNENKGAAVIEISTKGFTVKEVYKNMGRTTRRNGGPCVIYRCETTNEVIDVDYDDDLWPEEGDEFNFDS